MRFVTFKHEASGQTPGTLINGTVFSLKSRGFADMFSIIAAPAAAAAAAKEAARHDKGTPENEASLLAPLLRPPRIFGIGLNYASHASESRMKVQAVPTVFVKLSSSVIGPGAQVVLPFNSLQPDFEAELAVVIGEPGYRIAAADWEKHVFGYTIANDLSARDVQLSTSQWTLGKSFPTFTPLGPAIVTRDEIPDPHDLNISLTLNGELMQNANTRDMIFRIPQLMEYLSAHTPLEAGDIISTGTPEGVGLGRIPQRWIKPGDEMVVAIESLGELRNEAVAEACGTR